MCVYLYTRRRANVIVLLFFHSVIFGTRWANSARSFFLCFVFVSSVSPRGRRGGLGGQTARLVRYDNVSAKQTLYLFLPPSRPPYMLFFCQSVIFLLFPRSVVYPSRLARPVADRHSPDIHSPRYIFTLYGYIIFVYRTPSHIRRRPKS